MEIHSTKNKWKKISKLVDIKQWLLDNAIADSTKCRYNSILNEFSNFCVQFKLQPIPTDPSTIDKFLCHLFYSGKGSKIDQTLSAISREHIIHGYHDPTQNKLIRLLSKSIKKNWYKLDRVPLIREPFPIESLKFFIYNKPLDFSYLKWLSYATIVSLGIRCLCRSDEICNFNRNDIIIKNDHLIVNFNVTKTNQTGKVISIPVEKTVDPHCTYQLLVNLIELTRTNTVTEALFYDFETNQRYNSNKISSILKELCAYSNHHVQVSGHSLRIAGASLAAAKGLTVEQIRTLGRWADDSNVVFGYIRNITSNSSSLMDL